MDEKDFDILECIEKDARANFKEIADMVGIDEQEVKRRIKRLEDEDVILKYTTVIDWSKVKEDNIFAVVRIKVIPESKKGFGKLAREISKYSNVQDVFVVSGEYDLMVFIKGKTLSEVSDFVTEVLAPKKEVMGTYTHFVLRTYKKDGVVIEGKEGIERLPVSP